MRTHFEIDDVTTDAGERLEERNTAQDLLSWVDLGLVLQLLLVLRGVAAGGIVRRQQKQ